MNRPRHLQSTWLLSVADTWPSCTQQGVCAEVTGGERKPRVRHLPGRVTPSVPSSPALMQTWIQSPGCHTAEFLPGAVGLARRSFRHPPRVFATTRAAASSPNHPRGLPPGPHFGSSRVPMLSGPLRPQGNLAEWCATAQPQPSRTCLGGGVPTTPWTSQQPLRLSEGASPPLDPTVPVARTHPVC